MATTLFPPEVLIDQPTQIYGKKNVYYLYFSFSQFNTKSDIAAVQITLRDISNNNIIKSEQAPYGIYQFGTNDIKQKEMEKQRQNQNNNNDFATYVIAAIIVFFIYAILFN